MSSMALSAVLDKHISRLCLNQFPCGKGSWRKSKVNAEEADKEDTDMLLDLLSCPHSPWRMDELWSQQAAALRRVAVVAPERINADFICSFFSTLRIVDKDVSVIDDCLLKFCNLEELVLSANKISEISADNLPRTLKVLELRANCLSALGRLANSPPPRLQYLGLASNGLGSHCDVTQLTGRHWPQLVCLDLSDCDFQAQWPLLKALSTMPCLRTLVLEGNPFTLTPSYPGFTVDALPRLSYLDASWITPEERHRYRGMAKMSPVMVDWASATVRVGRMRGIPDPLINEEPDAPEFPIVSYSYLITYMFFSHQTTSYQEVDGKLKVKDRGGAGKTSKRSEKETSKSDASVKSDNSRLDTPCESRHSTSRRPWSTCVDFTDALTLIVRDVRGFKKFLSRGLQVHVEQEKVLSWPVEVSDDAPPAKDGQAATDKKREKQELFLRIYCKNNSKILDMTAAFCYLEELLVKTLIKEPLERLKPRTKRRKRARSWSQTPPSPRWWPQRTSPCTACSSAEAKGSASSVTLASCTKILPQKTLSYLRRTPWRRRKRRRSRRRKQSAVLETRKPQRPECVSCSHGP
ncbi:leucine-rich repeat-containing protein 43-like isoform X2 [Dunckerocampus dactyliophorus]|uniref:leucine-rich repeat-containing protein 43-like isoform X2 n=1 Tax=Dunckerocampus dactyliophorus TaxID=161453 RepID=UPI002404D865|nr:leucine-rich repeat-containing protein 43-like isoform X2 [Dunckerocampus dactyliophorus]